MKTNNLLNIRARVMYITKSYYPNTTAIILFLLLKIN